MTALFSSRFARSTLLALGLGFTGLAQAAKPPADAQQLLPAQSEIRFVSRQMGVPVQGQFRQFDAQLHLDTAHPENSRIQFHVSLASATVGAPESDSELARPAWFDTARFPQAVFQSSAVHKLGAGQFDVAGTLTIKGISQPLHFPVTLTQNAGVTQAVGSLTLRRLAFHIGENEWSDTSLVADEVQVRIKLALSGVPPL